MSLFFISNISKLYRFLQEQETLNLPFSVLTVAILIEVIGTVCEIFHLNSYSSNGIGSYWFDLGNQSLAVLAQFIIACLLITVASGYGLHYDKLPNKEIYLPVTLIFGVVHILIVCISRVEESDPTKFHDYEDLPGILLIIIRIVLWLVFGYFVTESWKSCKTQNQKSFYVTFALLGSMYLLSFPLWTIFAGIYIQPYNRHKFVVVGTFQLQIIVSIILTYLFTAKKSKYNKLYVEHKTLVLSKID